MKKNRVYEVARELGVPSREVQLAMHKLDYWPRSAATPMTEEEIQGVIELLRAGQSEPAHDEEHDTNG